MKKLTIINSPYDDSKLVFNSDSDRYELSLSYIKGEFGNTFADDGILSQRIKKNSRKIYNYIYANSCSYNKEIIYFVLKKTENGRKFLFDLMLEQMEADIETGYNDLSSQPAINVANGQVLDRNEFFRNQISVDAEQIADRSIGYFGFNIFYPSPFPFQLFRLIKEYNN